MSRAQARTQVARTMQPERTVPVAWWASRRRWAAGVLGALCFLVYLTSLHMTKSSDSIPARLLPFSILRQGNLDLDEFTWLRRLNQQPYFLRQVGNGHWLSRYPVGVPVLATPLYLPVTWWLRRHHIDDDDVRFRLASLVMERIIAALFAAASVSLVFLAATALTSRAGAALVALVYGLGTSTWAISSQALWQHGPAELGLAGLSLFLLAPGDRRHAAAAGSFAALAALARPTMLIFAFLALVFVWRERRSHLGWFLSVPLLGAGLLLAYHLRQLNVITGGYQYGRFVGPGLEALAGILFSPSRGVLIYTPIAALALPTLVRPSRAGQRWLAYASIGVAAYLLLYSSWGGWWGGHCYGPRFFADILPVLALCAIPAAERLWRRTSGRVLVVVLAVYGALVQGIGVYCDDNSWNAQPESVDHTPERVWDWSDPQILRAAHSGWHGFDLATVLWDSLVHPEPALLKPLAPSELAGEITTDESLPLRYRRAQTGRLDLRVTNLSNEAWPAFSDYGFLQVWLVYRWRLDGAVVSGEGGFISLPRNLGARHGLALPVQVDVPKRPGSYELEIRGAQALDRERGRAGSAVLRLPVQVE